jgi:hypothetical protein
MRGAIHSLPKHAFMAWGSVKKKHKDNFTFTFTLTLPRKSMLGGPLATTEWSVLRFRMEGSYPDSEGSCEYIE